MRRRPGLLARSQARAHTLAGGFLPSASTMRARMAAAALRVKVTARISSGSSTLSRSRMNRAVNTVVLPEPAGACSTIERLGSVASSRARASAALLSGSIIEGHLKFLILGQRPVGDAAQVRHIAVAACLRRRVDHCAPLHEVAHQRLDACLPKIARLPPHLTRAHARL